MQQEFSSDSWLPYSLFRVPAWRFAKASWLHARGKRPSRLDDDDGVRRAWRFLAAQRRTTPARRSRQDLAIQVAMSIWEEEDPHRRSVIEALLLTTEPMWAIAARFNLPVEAIECYHEVFFDVRPHLDASGWIMARAIGTTWWQGFTGLPIGALWKYVAYIGNPLVLDVMIAATTNGPLPDRVRQDLVREQIDEKRLRVKSTLLAKALTADSDEAWAGLVAAHNQVKRLDRRMNGTRDDAPDTAQPISSVVVSMVGRSRRRKYKEPRAPCAKRPADKPTTLTALFESLMNGL